MTLIRFKGFDKDHPFAGGAGSWPGAGSFEPGEVKDVDDALAVDMKAAPEFELAPKADKSEKGK